MSNETFDWDFDNSHPIVESAKFHDMTIEIRYDELSDSNPRDWDNLSVMVCDHPRYNLGDRQLEPDESEALGRGGWPLLTRYLRMSKGAVAVLPLWLYDHSGISISTGRTDSWDSGQIGFAYVDKERIEYLGAPSEDAEKQMRGEIEEYDSYLRGEVYGYIINGPDGDHLDSCWGFVGDIKYAKEEAEMAAKAVYADRFPISEKTERVGV